MRDSRPVLTEPLTRSELARWWRVSRNRIDGECERIDGAVRRGRRWQVPLHLMPFRFWLESGLIDREEFLRATALHCTPRDGWSIDSAANGDNRPSC